MSVTRNCTWVRDAGARRAYPSTGRKKLHSSLLMQRVSFAGERRQALGILQRCLPIARILCSEGNENSARAMVFAPSEGRKQP